MDSRVLKRVFLRSFLLQGTWNFERMQNLGFCYILFPVLARIYDSDEEMRDATKRHLEFFNTHPYLASPIIGAVVRMEEDVKKGIMEGDAVNTFKTGVMGSCGAIGDSFFWGSVKPLASVLGVCLAAAGLAVTPLLFLLVYNIPHLWMRIVGIFGGYREGPAIFERIRMLNFTKAMKKLRMITVLLSGVLLTLLIRLDPSGFLQEDLFSKASVALVFFLCAYLAIKKGLSVQFVLYTALFLAIGSSAVI